MTAHTSASKEFPFVTADFEAVRKRLKSIAGINLADSKDSMVYSRLSRRIRALNMSSFSQYLQYVDTTESEHQEFVNALTTNLTSFFREQHHFEELKQYVAAQNRPITIWCAASSTGEEPYSIAISVVEALGKFAVPVKIIASDIDSNVLQTASQGVYKVEQLDSMQQSMKKRFFHRGTGSKSGFAKVVPELRKLIEFKRINLMDTNWDLPKNIDIVFCRNVMIYFDKSTQLEILSKIVAHMQPHGLYFAGHSENFGHVNSILKPLGKTIYSTKSAH
ncbi:MAG: CheR family methyltransferase [Glaciecola sp.]